MNKYTITLNTIERARRFVDDVSKFKSDIDIISGRYICDAKSIMGIFSFDISKPTDIVIHSDDQDELIRFEEVIKKYEVKHGKNRNHKDIHRLDRNKK